MKFVSMILVAVAVVAATFRSEAEPRSLTDLVEANLKGEYQSIKDKIHGMKFGVVEGQRLGGVLDLGQCDADGFLIRGVYRSDPLDWLVVIATQIEARTNNLLAAGFPARLWKPFLGKYESAQLSSVAKLKLDPKEENRIKARAMREYRKLAATLNAYRRIDRSLPRVIVQDDCGGSGTRVYIVTEPPGASVYFIPRFYYDLCVAKSLNPDDRQRCNRWEEAYTELDGPGPFFIGSGEYIFFVRWIDSSRKGKIDFDKIKDGMKLTVSPER